MSVMDDSFFLPFKASIEAANCTNGKQEAKSSQFRTRAEGLCSRNVKETLPKNTSQHSYV